MGTLLVIVIVVFVMIVLGGIVALTIRSVLSVETRPLDPPSTLQTEPLSDPSPAESERVSPKLFSEPSHIEPREKQPEALPRTEPAQSFNDPSIIAEGPPSAKEVAQAALQDWKIGHIPFVGTSLAIDRYLKKLGHTPFTGMDAGYARIPGADKRKADETEKLSVTVSASGTILADDRDVSMAELEERLAALASRGEQIIYYAEPTTKEPPQAQQVLECIFRLGVSVKFAAIPDSSDASSDNG